MLSDVLSANKLIISLGLVKRSWGNVSAVDRAKGTVAIKPSGVNLEKIKTAQIASVSLLDGSHISGLKSSVDTPTHLVLYRRFTDIGAIVHTHSPFATAFAQARKSIECLGTTHADYFYGTIPVVYAPGKEDVVHRYEEATGTGIVDYFIDNDIDPLKIPAALCPNHGVFAWGRNLQEAIESAHVLELVAEMAYYTQGICGLNNPVIKLRNDILDKHFLRKHGDGKYYGQG
ncbi:MAG: L-ribulose-5-phosphate 4-epimerase [Flammeovirgaceae bacterium]|nr:L-ribulose-5-phosphate 4-epimerase [Flammeovirgaceae bacterium]